MNVYQLRDRIENSSAAEWLKVEPAGVCADRMYRPAPGLACSFVNFDGRSASE